MPRKRSTRTTGTRDTGIVMDQARHYMRYIRAEEGGEKLSDIARSEGVTTRAIEKSIRTVKYQKSLFSNANLNAVMMGMLLTRIGKVGTTFDRMFDAKDYIARPNADGSSELIPIDDKATQLEALRVFNSYTATMQPKGGGTKISIAQNNANQANAVATGKGGFESMLHEVIKEASNFNQLPPITADVIDDEDFSEEDDDDDESLTA